MISKNLTTDEDIYRLTEANDYAGAAKLLLKRQLKEWQQLADGYESLNLVQTKTINFNAFRIELQFNPGRIKSTSANLDDDAIVNRKCFLCQENLPQEQKGILLLEDYLLLCNPYPIFPEHFTLVTKEHRPQKITTSFNDLILISKMLSRYYTVIYNGPKCGASAPDHLHFQAGTKQFMPVENDFQSLKNEFGKIISEDEALTLSAVDDGLRKFIGIETRDDKIVLDTFNRFFEIYGYLQKSDDEPMINIVCNYEDENGWIVIVFIRDKHRSSHYYRDDKIVLSPASVDLGGVCITPVERDFDRINKSLLAEILSEVSLYKEGFEYIKAALAKKFSGLSSF